MMFVRSWSRWVLTVVALMGGELASAQDRLPPMPVAPKDTLVVDPRIFMRVPSPHVVFLSKDAVPSTDFVLGREPLATFWIGLGCSPITETLTKQLKLAPGVGLIVQSVAMDGPAAKAGIEPHDLLLALTRNDSELELRSVALLTNALNVEGDIALSVLRAGEVRSVNVSPVPRSDSADQTESAAVPARTLAAPPGFSPSAGGMAVNIAGPVFAFEEMARRRLPADVSVTIERTGAEPAKISIRRGEKTWETTEKDLAKIPSELHLPVAEMLNPSVVRFVPGMMNTAAWQSTGPNVQPSPYDSRIPGGAPETRPFQFTPDVQYFTPGAVTPGKPAAVPRPSNKAGQHVKAVKIDRVSPAQAAEIAQRIETEMTARLDQLQTLQTLNQLLEKQQQFQQIQQAAVARQEQLLQELQTKVETLLQAQQPASAEAAAGAAPQSN